MSPDPTGRRETRAFGEAVVLERTFRAPLEDVWAAVTEPDRLQRWIGTWEGDPTSGEVIFRMTAEGADAPAERLILDECVPPTHLEARVQTGGDPAQTWHWELTLSHEAGLTTLSFAQSVDGDIPVDDVAPGWEYYLDRLVTDQAGGDVTRVDFERDYHPAMSEHYRQLFA